jgi:hypothetical protein
MGVGDGVTVAGADADGDVEGVGVGVGVGDGDGFGDVVGVVAGVGEEQVTRAPLVVLKAGTLSGPGPWLLKYRASGTTMMPTITVRTKVTAPHSRRTKSMFTKGEV